MTARILSRFYQLNTAHSFKGDVIMQKLSIVICFFLLIFTGCSPSEPTISTDTGKKEQPTSSSNESLSAIVEFINTKNEKIGTAILKEGPDGVEMELNVTNLPPGKHGFHIHETGKCEVPDFKTAGGHFNPEGKQHGLHNSSGPHVGDLDNLVIQNDGKLTTKVMIPNVTLKPGEKNSLFKEEGTSLVIHEKEDDMKSDPAGNSGNRIACGVIEKKQ